MRTLRIVLTALLLALPAQADAALAFVGRVAAGNTASATTVAVTGNHAAGHLLVAMMANSSTTTVTGVADTASDTFAQCGTDYSGPTANSIAIFWTITAGNAANVVTATFSATSVYRAIVVYEISGSHASPCGNTGTGTAASTNITTTSSITVTAAEEIICMLIVAAPTISNATYNVTNFAITGDAVTYYADGYHIVTASEAATATQSTNGTYIVEAASFKVGAGGGAPSLSSLALTGAGQ